jgi:hypothetical protein
MMKGRQPNVQVVVDKIIDEWSRLLSVYDVVITIFEVFVSPDNKYAFRINGESPEIITEVLSNVMRTHLYQNFFILHSPASIPFDEKNKVDIIVESNNTTWRKIEAQDKIWILPEKDPQLPKIKYN